VNKRPTDIPSAIRQYTEIIDPKKKGYKLGQKNKRKLERIRELARRARGAR
jgi:hypothetical protein